MTDYLTTQQIADRLGVHPGHVRKMAVSLGVGQRLGRDWLFSLDDLTALQSRRTQPGPAPGTHRTSSPRPSDDGAA